MTRKVRPYIAKVLRLQHLRRTGEGGEVVQQKRPLEAELQKLALGDIPSAVCEACAAVGHRACYGHDRNLRPRFETQPLEIASQGIDKSRERGGEVLAVVHPITIGGIYEREASVSTADIADQNGVSRAQAPPRCVTSSSNILPDEEAVSQHSPLPATTVGQDVRSLC